MERSWDGHALGRQFKVFIATGTGLSPVCRFFSTSFAPKSSHFYTASPSECTVVKSNPDWQFEAEVFFVATPAVDGTCAAGTVPVYRLYNNGQGAAPNHRVTTDLAVPRRYARQGLDCGRLRRGRDDVRAALGSGTGETSVAATPSHCTPCASRNAAPLVFQQHRNGRATPRDDA